MQISINNVILFILFIVFIGYCSFKKENKVTAIELCPIKEDTTCDCRTYFFVAKTPDKKPKNFKESFKGTFFGEQVTDSFNMRYIVDTTTLFYYE